MSLPGRLAASRDYDLLCFQQAKSNIQPKCMVKDRDGERANRLAPVTRPVYLT